MSQAVESPITWLRSHIRGDVIGAADEGYDDSRRVWNAAIDRRPLVVARCLDEADVQAAVRFATDQGLEVAVRGGAHSMSGASVVDDGIVIDLSRMNQVQVDPRPVVPWWPAARCSVTSTPPRRPTVSRFPQDS